MGGAYNVPPARDSLKTPAALKTIPHPQNPTEANAVREKYWQLELLVPTSTRRNAPNADSGDRGRIGLGADPSNNKVAEGSTSSCALLDQGLGGGGSQEVTGL